MSDYSNQVCNKSLAFDSKWFQNVCINSAAVKCNVAAIKNETKCVNSEKKIKTLLKAIELIDLTTLAGDDTPVCVERLCIRAIKPLRKHLVDKLVGLDKLKQAPKVAAVCVYPSRVKDCVDTFEKLNSRVNIASVATGFPSGQYPLTSRLKEIEYAIKQGANEIDIVINRNYALNGDWAKVYDEVREMRNLCGEKAHLKAIIEAGELGSLSNVYKASIASMLAGADFVKTSTGKVAINATLPIGLVMTRAIWDFYVATGIKVGFKPAGGLRTGNDAIEWLKLVYTELGEEWLNADLLRFGASSLLNNIERDLFRLIYGRSPHDYEVSF
ncbi:putative deoxyribose-phosphate aldolase-like protein [Dinothrombium tinctorium]|uniref:deoxyribose-phosphate aldolase n=1 Tax=Dinothrombium tinctorium TaxID=1965070 RepID=A0A3S3NQC6_9ACAR|nr:putative deoxyribose-phosphate aldolase-like protein [Dinothrombium tinctorium]RWS04014.1 putative deoxyribose-phosphate aldolase-like protein [Dinothrombium tinctorium]RWS05502.1 putative deoxyribose-phosphate aldolase-like protein [Dinothrombium tinctorium]RWS05506.1 putative deoxyribose-phosphate aldolase-like protein [Dinothrombium tinctorium]